jgi:hypothetical protein
VLNTDIIGFGNRDILAGTITASDLNLTDITLADFTNDAGFVTTDNDTLNSLVCAANEVAKWNGLAWACAVDIDTDTDTTYTGSGGITLTHLSISVTTNYLKTIRYA